MKSTHLSRRLDVNELLKDLVRLRHEFGGALDFLVLLAGHPELDVLVAELGLEKCPEGGEAVWKERMNQTIREEAETTKKHLIDIAARHLFLYGC